MEGRLMLMLLLAMVPVLSGMAAGEMYKWVDEQGQVHYGDCPPVDCTSQRVETAPAPPARDTAAAREAAVRDVRDQQEREYECLSLVAVLPVMREPRMQELAGNPAIYQEGGFALLVEAIQRMADEGRPSAIFSLAAMHEHGFCVRGDSELAAQLYRRAAERGDAQAQHRLGAMQADCADRMRWWELAAEQGLRDAQFGLARLLRHGCTQAVDEPVRALMWYEVWERTSPIKNLLGHERDAFTQGLSAAQIDEAERLAQHKIDLAARRMMRR